MKILVVFTGGTIGSGVSSDGYIKTDDNRKYELIDMYEKRRSDDVSFSVVCPYMLLSENLDAKYINKLSECVALNIDKDYDGIIIAHGTDTLQYSAAAVSYALGNRCRPVVFVSSDYILSDSRQNGTDNFYYAVKFICQRGGSGVFAVSTNRGGKPEIHRGTRLLRHSEYSNRIESVFYQNYGHFENDIFIKNERYEEIEDEAEPFGVLKCRDECFVQMIVPYPNFCYPLAGEKTKAVLHLSYHSGTVCTASSELKTFCADLKRRNIPVFLAGSTDKNAYESTNQYEDLMFKILPPSAAAAMYMKIWIILSHGADIQNIYKSIGGDIKSRAENV